MARTCGGIYPMTTKVTTKADEEILKTILDKYGAKEGLLVCLLPDVSPMNLSINGGEYLSVDFLETSIHSVALFSVKCKDIGVKYQIQVEY